MQETQTMQPAQAKPLPVTVKSLFDREDVKHKFHELLGKRSTSFITSVLQITAQSAMLAKADPISVYQCAAMAATLDLPLNQNLGFAYIIPYKDTKADKIVAQFQIGYKGFIQLALRSGQFKTIGAAPIYEGQLTECNPLTGFTFDFTKRTSETVIGHAAHFSLLNGFEKTLYMSVEDLKRHGMRYSQTMKKGFGLWKEDFDAMAMKTVLKLLLSKFAPMSVEMQRAIISDQAVVNDSETIDVTYIDNEVSIAPEVNKESERISLMIQDTATLAELEALRQHVPDELMNEFVAKQNKLHTKAKK